MAFSLPVVCNDNPDQKTIIDACEGGICTQYDAESFANAVISILNMDGHTRSDMANRGKKYVESQRDYKHISSSLAQTYKQLLSVENLN